MPTAPAPGSPGPGTTEGAVIVSFDLDRNTQHNVDGCDDHEEGAVLEKVLSTDSAVSVTYDVEPVPRSDDYGRKADAIMKRSDLKREWRFKERSGRHDALELRREEEPEWASWQRENKKTGRPSVGDVVLPYGENPHDPEEDEDPEQVAELDLLIEEAQARGRKMDEEEASDEDEDEDDEEEESEEGSEEESEEEEEHAHRHNHNHSHRHSASCQHKLKPLKDKNTRDREAVEARANNAAERTKAALTGGDRGDQFESMRRTFLRAYVKLIVEDFGNKTPLLGIQTFPVAKGVQKKFLSTWRNNGGVLPMPLYHGTKAKNLRGIAERGLLVPGKGEGEDIEVENGSAMGVGVYTAKQPWLSQGFTDTNTMLLCAVIDHTDPSKKEDAELLKKIEKRKAWERQQKKSYYDQFGVATDLEGDDGPSSYVPPAPVMPVGSQFNKVGKHRQAGVPGTRTQFKRSDGGPPDAEEEQEDEEVPDARNTSIDRASNVIKHQSSAVVIFDDRFVIPLYLLTFLDGRKMPLDVAQRHAQELIDGFEPNMNRVQSAYEFYKQALQNDMRYSSMRCCRLLKARIKHHERKGKIDSERRSKANLHHRMYRDPSLQS